MTDYAGLVEYIVRNMVDHPDAVVVEAQPGRGRAQVIEISLDPEDVGRVIGKGGRNIEAIRAVVKAASIKDHERVNVEVIADDLPPEAEDPDGDSDERVDVARDDGDEPVDVAGGDGDAPVAAAAVSPEDGPEVAPGMPAQSSLEHDAQVHETAE